MTFRFRKSLKLAPGLRLNLSGSGLGLSVGPRGASLGIGKKGTFFNAGIPGTGISSRTKLSGSSSSTKISSSSTTNAEYSLVRIRINDDGELKFEYENGEALPEELIAKAKKQHRSEIDALLAQMNLAINNEHILATKMYLDTPSPNTRPVLSSINFDQSEPQKPVIQKLSFFKSLFKKNRIKNEINYENKISEYRNNLNTWKNKLSGHNQTEEKRKYSFNNAMTQDKLAMEDYLEFSFKEIKWPRETNVSFEISNDGTAVFMDVDLPEESDMPSKTSEIPQRGTKLKIRNFSEALIRKTYLEHIHAIAFRLIGEAFHSLPSIKSVIFSGFSQRITKQTGHIQDDYLLSIKVSRNDWMQINFSNLNEIEVISALNKFDIKIDMSKTGILKSIEPFEGNIQ